MTTLAALQSELEHLEDRIRQLRYERAQVTYKLEQCLKEADRIKRHMRAAARGEEEGAA
jgi:predicted nuclease with TOPRIM domain